MEADNLPFTCGVTRWKSGKPQDVLTCNRKLTEHSVFCVSGECVHQGR